MRCDRCGQMMEIEQEWGSYTLDTPVQHRRWGCICGWRHDELRTPPVMSLADTAIGQALSTGEA